MYEDQESSKDNGLCWRLPSMWLQDPLLSDWRYIKFLQALDWSWWGESIFLWEQECKKFELRNTLGGWGNQQVHKNKYSVEFVICLISTIRVKHACSLFILKLTHPHLQSKPSCRNPVAQPFWLLLILSRHNTYSPLPLSDPFVFLQYSWSYRTGIPRTQPPWWQRYRYKSHAIRKQPHVRSLKAERHGRWREWGHKKTYPFCSLLMWLLK